ncbi:enoyl-CoA hydratase/carnithine racemase [Bradyrhizobium macuxiense]|uniref:Enoyl-CoA hydratase/carnithine racemase n=1 Tax=Bradyrhizobium macuxiense TaxID=1755647 RepID=A0A560KPT3_9BRAD|nr:enoyl-CoA hydratase/isomerase family protein [Bradyrhizobium macuxiense]TWB85303.1 enoyl-CoA hydratase/carnithine racemase [Bradyrhizobium macuxiense]
MTYSAILYKVDDRVARITLNRPDKMNAISLKLCAEFEDALEVADRDPEVRVILVTGAGGRAFAAGFDLNDEDEDYEKGFPERTLDDLKERRDRDFKFNYCPFNCSKPVIAMINGYCLGGALEFSTMFDIRYCSDDALFAVTETRFATGILTLGMPWVIGQRCRELIYTGDTFDATEAYRLGLVSRVFPKDQLEEEVMRIAKRISRVAMHTLKWNKRALNNTLLAAGFDSALRQGAEAYLFTKLSVSEYRGLHEILRSEGVKAAIRWQEAMFGPFESETQRSFRA